MISLMKKLNLPSDLRSAISHLLDTPTAHLFVNRKTLASIICNAALAQGDPISTILFVLLVVPLHLALERNSQPFDLVQNYRPSVGHTVNASKNGSTGPRNYKISTV